MLKYILKRLGLSVIVLLGVSLIIYFLVRLMPTDYLENKFSAQLQQGTITPEKIDDFKKNYGLYMPEAYLDITISDGKHDGAVLRKDAKTDNFEDVQNGYISYQKFYAGNYELDGELKLELKDDASWVLYELSDETSTRIASGTYVAESERVLLTSLSGVSEYAVAYKEAGFFDGATVFISGK